MVDSLSPLPPLSTRVAKTHVSDKNPNHQNSKQKKPQEHKEIQDEIAIELPESEETLAKDAPKKPKTPPYSKPEHNIDIEV